MSLEGWKEKHFPTRLVEVSLGSFLKYNWASLWKTENLFISLSPRKSLRKREACVNINSIYKLKKKKQYKYPITGDKKINYNIPISWNTL